MKIAFVSYTYLGSPFVVGSHHLSRALSKLGHEAAHISSPLNFASLLSPQESTNRDRVRLWRHGLSRAATNEPWNLVPFSLLPWQTPLVYRILRWNPLALSHSSIARSLRSIDMATPDVLLIDDPRMIGIERALRPRLCIYRPTDRTPYHTGDLGSVLAEKSLLKHCQGVIATSSVIIDDLSPLTLPSMVLINGVDYDHFASFNQDPIKLVDRPRCIYVGALDSRFGWKVLLSAAKLRPQYDFLLAGPLPDQVPELPSNVRLLGTVDYAAVPALLHSCHVALLPLSNHPSNDGRSPMKFYEYLAAGLPVVSTSTKELRRRKQAGVLLTDDANEFANALDVQIQAKIDARMDWSAQAKPWAWESRAKELLEFVKQLDATRSGS